LANDDTDHGTASATSQSTPPPPPPSRATESSSAAVAKGSRSHKKKAAKASKKTSSSSKLEKPKRPLSAYNLFFKDERAAMLKEMETVKDGKDDGDDDKKPRISFEQMAKRISSKWNTLDSATRQIYQEKAQQEKEKYLQAKEVFLKQHAESLEADRARLEATVPDEIKQQYLASQGGAFTSTTHTRGGSSGGNRKSPPGNKG